MSLQGIDAVVFGVEDLVQTDQFLTDWGLTRGECTAEVLRFTTRDGSEVVARRLDDPALPPAWMPGSTIREVIWGAASQADLDALVARNSDDLKMGDDGLQRMADPSGLSHAFRLSTRRHIAADPTQVNAPGAPSRIDKRSPVYDRAHPVSVGHVVLNVDNLPAMSSFFMDRLGFHLSDSYPGAAVFLRAAIRGGHHDVFLLSRPGAAALNHVAFTVQDLHEVVGGGIAMSGKGWRTDIGPGRHPISSAYFWYLQSPLGGSWEYYADEDYCTEDWVPGEFERRPENFAEWAVAGGIDAVTRRQSRAPSTAPQSPPPAYPKGSS
jgi:catechol 2,3-dioxygenase-like lactoylglutathione lyase family enzyme